MKVPSSATQRTMRRIAHPRRTRRADARGLTVIDVIKAEMRQRRMTQQELAELTGLSEPLHSPAPGGEVKTEVRDGGTCPALSRV